MDEKRKAKRLILDAHLVMNRIDSGKHDLIPVDIIDLSTNGLGFKCDQVLEINRTPTRSPFMICMMKQKKPA